MNNQENQNHSSSDEVIFKGNQPSPFSLSKKNFSYFALIISVCLILFLFILSSPWSFPKDSIFNIKEGASLRSVSFELKEKKYIRSRIAFEAFVIIRGGERRIIPGDYFFDKKTPVYKIAQRISRGKKNIAPIKITIPEGFNISEMKDLFSSKLPNFNGEEFVLKAKDKEGYLFPDTYFFFTTDTEDSAIEYMTTNFNKKIKSLENDILAFGKSEKDIIIMASLIEKEAKGDSDREYISGILWKRLSINMPLQVDAAPTTYKERGLPSLPISNPGLKSIVATIKPKTSPYLYYLHDKEGNIHYARNFEEHKINKSKYLK